MTPAQPSGNRKRRESLQRNKLWALLPVQHSESHHDKKSVSPASLIFHAFHSVPLTPGPDSPSVTALRSQVGIRDTEKASAGWASGRGRNKDQVTWLPDPRSQLRNSSSGSLSSWLWKLISYSFRNYLLPSSGMCAVHAQACVPAYTFTSSLSSVRV